MIWSKKHLEILFWWFFRTLAQLNHLLGFSTIDKRKENNGVLQNYAMHLNGQPQTWTNMGMHVISYQKHEF